MNIHRTMKSDSNLKSQIRQTSNIARLSAKKTQDEADSQLPLLADTPKDLQEDLFIHKLIFCSQTYNFFEPTYMNEKQIKFTTLKELISFVTEEGNVSSFTEAMYRQVIETVSDNIFRSFPPVEYTDFDPEYDEQQQEAAWPHLKLVYELFLHLVNSQEVNVTFLRKVISRQFIVRLLDVFNSEDGRERKCLKNMLLSIYLKLFELRSFIRKQIRNIFLIYVYEVEQFNGIAELLEILSMTINGFNVPLKEEHKNFLTKVLIPLHKPRYLAFYQRFLIECLKGYIRKDENLVHTIIMGILKFWPKMCSEKEVLFLQEIEELFEIIPSSQFVKIQEPLIKQISISISSLHFQVAETAINFWQNPDFLRYFTTNLKVMMPIVFPELYRISENHWNKEISDSATRVLLTFQEADSVLYKSLVASYKPKEKQK